MSAQRRPVLATLLLAFCVIVVGAYVRLSDAGLGCPDWPLCYGRAMPGDDLGGSALHRAWKEMAHRYLAGALGLLIVALLVLAWKRRRGVTLAGALVLVVVFQATLGMWTVTLLLRPAIVTAHLLGGMTTLALLLWLFLSLGSYAPSGEVRALRWPALTALAAVAIQITLGGWVSANYAALACPDLPLCLGAAAPPMDFHNAFHVFRELGQTGTGERLPAQALTAIHWSHRLFALLVVAVVGWAAFKAMPTMRALALGIALLLTLQFCLGIANVAFSLPLALAAAHNAGAALLLASLVVLNFFSFRGLRPSW
ncbi:MAG TPA: COX15/CtaA family protein [Burkholderiales bacterium]|nr:COX15/CtaA family protein [Burkholderiales bacterium]